MPESKVSYEIGLLSWVHQVEEVHCADVTEKIVVLCTATRCYVHTVWNNFHVSMSRLCELEFITHYRLFAWISSKSSVPVFTLSDTKWRDWLPWRSNNSSDDTSYNCERRTFHVPTSHVLYRRIRRKTKQLNNVNGRRQRITASRRHLRHSRTISFQFILLASLLMMLRNHYDYDNLGRCVSGSFLTFFTHWNAFVMFTTWSLRLLR